MEFADKKLDGSRIAAEIRDEVSAEVVILTRRGVIPRIDAVLVFDDLLFVTGSPDPVTPSKANAAPQ